MRLFHIAHPLVAGGSALLCFALVAFFFSNVGKNPSPPLEYTNLVPIEVSVAELQGIFPAGETVPEAPPMEVVPEEVIVPDTTPEEGVRLPAEPLPEQAGPATPITEPPAPPATITLPPEITSNHPLTQNEIIQRALVNILCIATPGSGLASISGSGVIIDGAGTILTNAHIAQMFLLKNYPAPGTVSCTIRTGSPAVDAYTAELIYLSPRWIFENATAIATRNPVGTGKDDFALLSIAAPIQTSTSLPSTFTYLPLSFAEISPGEAVISAGYPASFLESETIRRGLVLVAISGTIRDVFTFGTNTADVLSLGGIALAQQGSSGGAVIRANNTTLGGLIVTSSLEAETLQRDLRAISTAHIARSFQDQHNKSLATVLGGNMELLRQEFLASTAPVLRELLIEALTR